MDRKSHQDPKLIDFNNFYMGLAILTSFRSIQPNKKGACIVSDKDKRILGLGYNSPCAIPSEEYHASTSALIKKRAGTEDATLYVTHYPCNDCAKVIIQSQIKQIVYMKESKSSNMQTEDLLQKAGVELVKFNNKAELIANLTNLEYIPDEEYFMSLAMFAFYRSKQELRNGSCLVNPDGEVITLGWNGMPTISKGQNDEKYDWGASKDNYICHAELNCLVPLIEMSNHMGSSLYTEQMPCLECAKLIVQARVAKVTYIRDEEPNSNVENLLQKSNIKLVKFRNQEFVRHFHQYITRNFMETE